MKQILLAGLFASLCAAPAVAAEFEKGDRGCLGYDAKTHSCMSIQEVVSVEGGTLTVADRTILKLGTKPLTLKSRGSMARDGEGYCIKPNGVDYQAEPASHPYATAMPNMLRKQMGALTEIGHCVTHRFCGNAVVVNSFIAGTEQPSLRQVFTVFRKDDPNAVTLKGRETTVAQMERLGKVMPAGCEIGAS